jgi:hypothetical protein
MSWPTNTTFVREPSFPLVTMTKCEISGRSRYHNAHVVTKLRTFGKNIPTACGTSGLATFPNNTECDEFGDLLIFLTYPRLW